MQRSGGINRTIPLSSIVSGAVALLAGIGLFIGTNHSQSNPTSLGQIKLNTSSWNWVSKIKVGVNEITLPAEKKTDTFSIAAREVPKPKRILAPVRRVRRKVQVAPVLVGATPAKISDQMVMQSLHQALRSQFLLAATAVVNPEVIAANIQVEPVITDTVTIHVASPKKVERKVVVKKRATRKVVTTQRPIALPKAPEIQIAPVSPIVKSAPELKPAVSAAAATKIEAPAVMPKVNPSIPSVSNAQIGMPEAPQVAAKSESIPADPIENQGLEQKTEVQNDVSAGIATPPAIFESVSRTHLTTQIAVITQVAPVRAPAVVPAKHEYSPQIKVEYPKPAPTYAQNNAVPPTTPPGRREVHTDQQMNLMGVGEPSYDYVEAFDWGTPILQALSEELTHEKNSAGRETGWRMATAPMHWPTVYWLGDKPVPLLSNNNSLLLARLAGSPIHEQAGIVFGKVAPGWSVEISGRSDAVVFLNSKNQVVSADQLSANSDTEERYFAFLNVEPGAQLIYVTKPSTGEVAAVGMPVLQGASTYADLSAISKRQFSGWVLDAAKDESRGLKRVQVQVIGQHRAAAVTTNDGAFRIPEAITVGSYPVYVETEAKTGFTHRYRITLDKTEELTLYRVNEEQVQTWVGQLEGGLSIGSGLVLAAVPGLIADHLEEQIFPGIRTVQGKSALIPETYTLSAEGDLLVNRPLEPVMPRFLSLQIPEGPVVAYAENKAQSTLWSEMVFVSPNVISVLGPY